MHPIRLKTLYGNSQFDILYWKMKKSADKELFKLKCQNDYDLVGSYFKYFLEDDEMKRLHKMDDEDIEGWRIFNELSDLSSCLRYFSGNFA